MPDTLTPIQRHLNMVAIKGKDTKPEMMVRRWLHANGLRYRLHVKELPGKPDIVLPKYKTCVFVNGCFWHGHNIHLPFDNLQCTISSDCCKIPKTNREFWVQKIMRNKERDLRDTLRLKAMGWSVVVIWECQLRKKQQREIALIDLLAEIKGRNEYDECFSMVADEELEYNSIR